MIDWVRPEGPTVTVPVVGSIRTARNAPTAQFGEVLAEQRLVSKSREGSATMTAQKYSGFPVVCRVQKTHEGALLTFWARIGHAGGTNGLGCERPGWGANTIKTSIATIIL